MIAHPHAILRHNVLVDLLLLLLLLILEIRRTLQILALLLLLRLLMMVIVQVATVLVCRYEYTEGVLTVHAGYTVDSAHSLWLRNDAFLPLLPSSPSAFSSSSSLLPISLPPPSFFFSPPSLVSPFLLFLLLIPSRALLRLYTLLFPLFSSPHLREGLLETGRCTGPEIPIPTSVGLNF